ncbi:uncharacterized protein A1O9_05902 [Exophiala aquamarina CBS 119918]|uniref:C3H1-type domain-containing protein n=1 Tax=Exophiala aquamarina CBS 119918 TaxID=1182545 RepID=A0A072PD06_9EURO|nr:uncharacterized protein A1O9_05902 [Exophiala aquamarina CBS 119918]KEF57979.1 hypothetical protein A1O9_05902 [Exophiala aquamarina CBS 119918]
MASFKTRVEQLLREDAARSALLEEMLAELESLTSQHDAVKRELAMSQDTARTYYEKMVQAQTEASKRSDPALEGDRFVLVLVDADSVPFLDDLVAKGKSGGDDAGKHLRIAVEAYHRSNPNYHPDDRIIIRAFANTLGSGRTYKAARVIPDETVFNEFVAGFNRSHPLSELINAGNHKEAADAKMKANFELFCRNRHCQHILFAGSADSGYAGFLGPYSSPNGVNEKITLIEGPPFPFDLKRVARGFQHTTFPTVFRSSKIHVSPSTPSATMRTKRAGPELTSNRERPTLVVAGTGSNTPSTPRQSATPFLSLVAPAPLVYQNKFGQRIDPPLNIDKDYLQFLYQHLKLCNNFYLKGYCPYGSNCEFDHSKALTSVELDTFRYKARTSSCRTSFCQDPTCCLGHTCPRGENCTISMCKFAPEMHNPDVSDLYQFDPATNQRQHITMPV